MTKPPFPLKALQQHVAILGKTRSGKSTVLRGVVEGLLERQEPVCIVDPKGDWWGLKISADGKGPGFALVIFGGEHADVPINEHSGAAVAELFATGNRPCLIDLGGWMPGARTRFWVDFASALFRLNKGQRWLVVDEIHNFAPKGKVMDPGEGKSLHWTNRLASEGLGRGIAMLFASQRPQKVHNDTLTQAETLIAMRVMHPADQGAITDWIKTCGDAAKGREVLDSLAQLERGEGWVWSPEIGFGPARVKFPMFKTYDSFRPQTAEDAKKLKGWAEVDLEDVKAKLAAVVKEAEAKDPKRLQARIAELERQIGKPAAAPAPDQQAIAAAEQRGRLRGVCEGHMQVIDHLRGACNGVREASNVLAAAFASLPHVPAISAAPENKPAPAARQAPKAAPAPRALAAEGQSLTKAARLILTALAQYPAGRNQVQVGLLSGYSHKGGGFRNTLGALRSKGWIVGGGDKMTATDAGLEALGPFDPLPVGAELRAYWLSQFGGAHRAILSALFDAYPEGMDQESLGAAAGYEPKGGGFRNALGKLRTLELINRGTPIVASEDFFQ
jgi:hypothetical protein